MRVLYIVGAALSISAFALAFGFAGSMLLIYVEIHK